MRARRQLVVAALAAVVPAALVVTYLLAFQKSASYSSVQNKKIGMGVVVTGDEVPNDIRAIKASGVHVPSSGLDQIGQTVEVTSGTKLSAPIALRFPLDNYPAGSTVLIATSETPNGPWKFMQPTVSADGRYATVQTNHLSFWSTVWGDTRKIVSTLKSEAKSILSGDLITQAQKPHCNNQSAALQDGYTIASSAKDTLYWCFGVEGGQRVLKIVNRMRYPLEVAHTGFVVKDLAGQTVDLDQLARLGSGQSTILYPFEEADYTVDLSTSGGHAAISA